MARKNNVETQKSKFSMRKRIKEVQDISEKTQDIQLVGNTGKRKNGTTVEFQNAYGSLSKDPRYAKESFISNYDKIIESQDYVGIDFITIQTFITKDSSIKAATLDVEVKEFLKFLWSYLCITSNVEVSEGVTFEVIEVAGLIVPVVNSGLAGQSITKQTVGIEKVLAAAVSAGAIGGNPQISEMIELFFKVLVESAQFGYIIQLGNVLLFRREGGNELDLSIIPGKDFFYGQGVIKDAPGFKNKNPKSSISPFK